MKVTMKTRWILWTACAVAGLGLLPVSASAQPIAPGAEPDAVNAWFQKYLGRPPSAKALAYWSQQIRQGMPGARVQGSILSSDDYYAANGKSDEAFIVALFRDVAGRPTSVAEVRLWVARMQQVNNRSHFAEDFVNKSLKGEFAPITVWNPNGRPGPGQPAPVVPVVAQPVQPVVQPVVIPVVIIPPAAPPPQPAVPPSM